MGIGRSSRWASVVAVIAVVAACAPSAAPGRQSAFVQQDAQPASRGGANFEFGGQQAAPLVGDASVSSDKTLVIGLGTEVRGFSLMNNNQQRFVEDLVGGNLFLQDEQGRWFPAIAAEAPRLDNGTWKLFEDGTSETTYRLKRGVKWHDGVEFTVHDLVFFWRVGNDLDLPYDGRNRTEAITGMDVLDPYTVRVTWAEREVEADSIDLRMMWPMPRHILEESYNRDKQEFLSHPFWTTGFVGLGPYKLTRFELGSHLELTANDDYVLGKPKIRNIVVRFYQDTNVLISALLAGDVHLTLHGALRDGSLSMGDGIVLGNQWSATGEGRVIFNPYRINVLAAQWQREFQQPAALADVRLRQALLHAIDRGTLVSQKFGGFTEVAHGWIHPTDPDYAMFAEAITRYDFDPARAQRLLADVGYQRAADGMLVDASGRKLELEYRAQGRDAETTAVAVADYWKRVGVDTQLVFIPTVRARDNEWMAKFPGIRSHGHATASIGGATNSYQCDRVPSERNRWVTQQQNPGGYCTPEIHQRYEAWREGFPFEARLVPFREMMRVALRDLPYLPLHYESEAVAVRSNVGGINRVPPKNRGRLSMLAYTWTIR